MTTLVKSGPTLLDRMVEELADFNESNPTLVPKLMKMTANDDTPAWELAQLLSHDPGLTATALRLANSAFFGRCRAVATVQEAVNVLGFSLLRSIIVAANMASVFAPGEEAAPKQRLWDHSLAVALCSRMVAGCVGRAAPEEAFLAGLMHDVGILVLLRRFPAEYAPLLSESKGDSERQLELETEVVGASHAQLGAILLENWNFPPRIIDAVRCHHSPSDQAVLPAPIDDEEAGNALAHIVCFSDQLASCLGYGCREPFEADWSLLPSVVQLNLTPESIAWIAHNLNELFAEERLLLMPS